MTYAEKLRAMADYLDDHPLIAEKMNGRYDYPSNYIYATDWAEFQELIGDLGGFDKAGAGGSLTAKHYEKTVEPPQETLFYVSVSVSGVCEQKPKLDEEGEPVMRKKSVYVETDELEAEVEWVCPEVWSS